MNRIFLISFLVFGALFTSCRKNLDNLTVTEKGAIPYEGVQSSLYGRIVGPDGAPVVGAAVVLDNTPYISTNDNGLFFFHNRLMNKNGEKITVIKDGYFETVRYAFPRLGGNTTMEIKLIPKVLTTSFLGATGATFTIGTGGTITIPANGVSELASGSTYTGLVNVYAVYLDPSDPETFRVMPGDLRAMDTSGYAKVLKSYGMIGVELESSTGQKLQLSDGKKAKIVMAIPGAFLSSAPAVIPLWHFDTGSGYWKEEGNAALVNNRYEGEVAHFSFWNCDVPTNYVIVRGRVLNDTGVPVANLQVSAKSSTIFGIASGITDAEGYFGGAMPADETLELSVFKSCNLETYYQNTIGPFSTDTEIPVIEITGDAPVRITGKLIDCTNNPLPNGVVYIEVNGTSLYVIKNSDANGNFEILFEYCGNADINITAYQPGSLLQSEVTEVAVNGSNNIDVGAIPVCSQLDEYIVINGDGKSHTFYSQLWFSYFNGKGSINGSGNQSSQDTVGTIIGFSDYNPVTMEADVNFFYLVTGELNMTRTYQCNYCDAPCNCSPTQTGRIKFSSFPSAPGEYAIGTLSANIKNENDQYVPFVMNFRLRQ